MSTVDTTSRTSKRYHACISKALVLALTLAIQILSTVSTVKEDNPSSNPLWLIDVVPSATNTGTDNATWVDVAMYGQSFISLVSGLPTSEGEVFVQTANTLDTVFDNIRIYTRSGEPLLTYSSNYYGTVCTIIKSTEQQNWIITTTYWARGSSKFLRIQPISIKDGQFAVLDSPITETTYMM